MAGARRDGGSAHSPLRPLVVALPVVVSAAVIVSALVVWSGSAEPAPDLPNIVLIVTDDQRWDTLAAMPAVQRHLVDRGVTFRNAFAPTPVCCPARASLLTGQYSHTTGVLDGSTEDPPGGAPAFDDASTLATWLDDAGYRTGLVGKYLNDYAALPQGYVPPGWDEWFAIADSRPQIRYYDYRLNENGRIVPYGTAASEYSTSVLTEEAVRFIRGDDPFFLLFAPIAPHLPAIPAPGDAGVPVPAWDPSPPSLFEDDGSPGIGAPADVEAVVARRAMLRSLVAVDRAIDAIAEALDAAGASGDTYLLYTSDNGFLWGEHRIVGKVWPYEESIRVPLVIRPPGLGPTRTRSQLVLNVDVALTIAELAGVDAPVPADGKSLVPLLDGRAVPWRDEFLVEFLGFAPDVPPYVGVRTRRYLYVEYRNGRRELFDLRADPYEVSNLLASSDRRGFGEVVHRLRATLRRLAGDTDDGPVD